MKLLNLTEHSIFISDIGNNRNGGTDGRKTNQARYIPTGLDENGDPDTTLAIQLVETGAVKISAAKGEISSLISEGKLQLTSLGENIERTLTVTKTGSPVSITQVFLNDVNFGRPIKLVSLKLTTNANVPGGKTISVQISKDKDGATGYEDATATQDLTTGLHTATFDISALTFTVQGGGSQFEYNGLLKIAFASGSGATVGITSATMVLTYSLVD